MSPWPARKSAPWPAPRDPLGCKPCGLEVITREVLRAMCEPFFEQMLDAVEQALQARHYSLSQCDMGDSEALKPRPYTFSRCDTGDSEGLKSRRYTFSHCDTCESHTENPPQKTSSAEHSTDIDSNASECKALSSQISTTEQGDSGYQADSDEIVPRYIGDADDRPEKASAKKSPLLKPCAAPPAPKKSPLLKPCAAPPRKAPPRSGRNAPAGRRLLEVRGSCGAGSWGSASSAGSEGSAGTGGRGAGGGARAAGSRETDLVEDGGRERDAGAPPDGARAGAQTGRRKAKERMEARTATSEEAQPNTSEEEQPAAAQGLATPWASVTPMVDTQPYTHWGWPLSD